MLVQYQSVIFHTVGLTYDRVHTVSGQSMYYVTFLINSNPITFNHTISFAVFHSIPLFSV